MHWIPTDCPIPTLQAFRCHKLTAFVGREAVTEDGERWHMSISHPKRYPTWDEIHAARYDLMPENITVAMFLPPKNEYVNLHPNCFHLWETTDASPV